MATIIREVESTFYVTQDVSVANGSTLPIYGSVERGDNYFAMMLEGQRWMDTPRLRKLQALVSATRRIEQLRFYGEKHDASQPLQFPRGTDTLVPVEIEQACYELAQTLLKGVDPDKEADNLSVTVLAFGQLRSEQDRSFVPPYVRAGIPSQTAWNLLLPFLDPDLGITLQRVS
ncbi:MAG: hypothetical protein E6R03_18195 [Hyphomicrobiaceae bacterium]|nr:MAG: hypothetical protein E6R03_18195 [Hyphomicrobiaceae bacterium]